MHKFKKLFAEENFSSPTPPPPPPLQKNNGPSLNNGRKNFDADFLNILALLI